MATRTSGGKAPAATRAAPVAKAQPAKARTAAKAAPAKPVKGKTAKPDKPRKPKLVRDSFTMPKPEYAVIGALKERAVRLGRPAKKSELLRAGVKALAAMPDAAFLASVRELPEVKTGRPAKTT